MCKKTGEFFRSPLPNSKFDFFLYQSIHLFQHIYVYSCLCNPFNFHFAENLKFSDQSSAACLEIDPMMDTSPDAHRITLVQLCLLTVQLFSFQRVHFERDMFTSSYDTSHRIIHLGLLVDDVHCVSVTQCTNCVLHRVNTEDCRRVLHHCCV